MEVDGELTDAPLSGAQEPLRRNPHQALVSQLLHGAAKRLATAALQQLMKRYGHLARQLMENKLLHIGRRVRSGRG